MAAVVIPVVERKNLAVQRPLTIREYQKSMES